MGRFLREPDQERLHNAAKMESWYSQTSESMQSVDTNACIQFWNRKAEEICHSPSYAKWPKNTITAVIVTEWSVKKTTLLFNHATRLMDQKPEGDNKRKQKVDIVHQGPVVQNPN